MTMFGDLFSWSTLLGVLFGFGLQRAYEFSKACYQNRHAPLPNGEKHHMPSVNRTWLASAIALGVVAWSIFQIEVTARRTDTIINDARTFSAQVKDCQREFNAALAARSKIAADNDKWSAIQRKALGDWLFEILNPPPDIGQIRATDPNFQSNPRYQQWGIDVTQHYYTIINHAQREQDDNIAEREQHPLPEPTCGR